MPEQSRFTTHTRAIGRDGKLSWGTDTHPWSGEMELFDEVVFNNGRVRPGRPAPDSGISRWTFDNTDTQNGVAIDSWGDNNGSANGVTLGASSVAQYDSGEAYGFDGQSSDVQMSDDGSLQDLTEFSLSFWFNSALGHGDGNHRMVFKSTTGNWDDSGFCVYVRLRSGDTGKGIAWTVDGEYYRGGTVTPGEPYFVVGTWDGTELHLYVDGELIGSTPYSTASVTGSPPLIGRSAPDDLSGTNNRFRGRVDDIRLYEKALTSDEISNLRTTGRITG